MLHTNAQAPFRQLACAFAGALQTLAHPPQFCASDTTLMQALPHFVVFVSQSKPQLPALHFGTPLTTLGQTLSQTPQCVTLLLVSTQPAPHWVWPALQPALQVPPLQTLPVSHATPQPPQLFGSAFTSTQAPLQSVKPGLHAAPHTPSVQVALAFAGGGHAIAQPPQFCGSLALSTHDRPHFCKPLQSNSQLPPLQVGVPPLGAVHFELQLPQLSGSLATWTSQPLAMFESQLT
jgi:hypothetical protein